MLVRIFLICVGLSVFASGQAKKDPYRYVRFLPLGNEPQLPRKLDPKTKTIIMGNAKPGEDVPRQVAATDEVPQVNPLEFQRDRLSRFVAYGPKVAKIEITEGEQGGGKKFLTTSIPKLQRSLIVLYRDHRAMNWFTPKSLTLKDDLKTFPLGSMRFANVSDQMMVLTFSVNGKVQKPMGLPPGKTHVAKVSGTDVKLKIEVLRQNEREFIKSNQIKVDKDRRTNVIFYKDGKPRALKPVLVYEESEKYPALPKLPKLEDGE